MRPRYSLRRMNVAVALAVALSVSACGDSDTQTTPRPADQAPTATAPAAALDPAATATFALNIAPKTLDPGVGVVGWNTLQLGAGETLQRVTRDGLVEPWLAEKVSRVDERTWSVALRPGVTFFDGSPVNASAVKASLERSVAKLPNLASLLDVASIEAAADGRTVTITSKNPNPGLASALAHFNAVIHDAAKAESDNAAFALSPNLTGAFKPTAFRVDAGVKMIRNESYWSDKAKVAAVDVRFVPDAAARTASALAGEVDLAYQLPPEQLGALRARSDLKVESITTGYQYFVIFNTRKPMFAEPAVRKAIDDAIDRDALVKGVMQGTAKAATGAISPIFPFALSDGGQRNAATVEARLDTAGWKRGADGVRSKDGQRFSIVLLTYPQRPELGNLAVAIQSQLKAIGVDAQIKTVDQINTELSTNDWDASMYAVNTAPTGDPAPLLNAFYRTGGGSNFGKFSSAQIDSSIEGLMRTAEPSSRREAALAIQRQLNELSPHAYLMAPQFNLAMSKRLQYQLFPSDYYIIDNQFGIRR